MTAPKTVKRSLAALFLPKPVPALINYARSIVKAMTGNPAFPNPVPALAAVTAAIDELQAAETIALTRAHGATAVRDEKRRALVSLLQPLRAYVQAQADAAPDNAPSI